MGFSTQRKIEGGMKIKKQWRNFFKDINKYFKQELEVETDGGVEYLQRTSKM
jgi:hypothetical protein